MTKKVVTVTKDATFADAAKAMIDNKTNGAVVVDDNKKVVGILSSWDLIQYVVPDYLEADKHLAAFESADVFAKRVHAVKDAPISKFMSKHVHSTKPEDSIMEAATLLSEFRIRQLPVVDDAGVLVGYINRTDIKRAIGEVLGLSE
ncbi:MAG: hypothetical protein A3F54_02310 [Candidatus Kerfeldbacteria bacterium RIFCSPHIGHO2_12_FULL_48_17]|uniref:CBS domain-containing protein n=1 Tax=Candidatus Kerfeldbacteria bacterium RIFCSPHIGHO2_12_FULL_48_17 TaxID=1798542 RepID=A0A1G2AZK5_9BACT|nr:MAG: hypothetical protein A3F54_02310 [Candidatus Kerfeldbacteria bacterium RIFCSPHIGHO2_12_FULL_48_17]